MKDAKVVALVIKKVDKDWGGLVNVTEYYEDGTWLLGMNLITTIEEILNRAWKEKLNIIPESRFAK